MRKFFWAVLIAFMLSADCCITLAGPLDDGIAAYERGDYATALRLFRPLAQQGDGNAQYILGFSYDRGRGVTQDSREAVKWFRLAAEQGVADAQNDLGVMYALGRGVTKDNLRAYMWLNLAASKLGGDSGQLATRHRDTAAKTLSPTQIKQAQKIARRCEANSFKNCD
jgi:uncharacterized protein